MKYKLHYSEERKTFNSHYIALTQAVVKVDRFLKEWPLRAMNNLTKSEVHG